MTLDLEAIALDLLLGSDSGTLSASSGGIHLDFKTSTGLHPLRRAVQALVLREEALLAARARAAKLEEIRAWAAGKGCFESNPWGTEEPCIPCLARALGASKEKA